MAAEDSEIPKITAEKTPLKTVTPPKDVPDPKIAKELEEQKTTQAVADKTEELRVHKEIARQKENSDVKPSERTKEGVSKPEKSINEQADDEREKLRNCIYGNANDKLDEIEMGINEKMTKKGIEIGFRAKERLKIFKDINAQLKNNIPPEIYENLDFNKDIHPENNAIPSYWLRIGKDGVRYDPNYNPNILTSEGRFWTITHLKKPNKERRKELQNFYNQNQAKATELPVAKKPA